MFERRAFSLRRRNAVTLQRHIRAHFARKSFSLSNTPRSIFNPLLECIPQSSFKHVQAATLLQRTIRARRARCRFLRAIASVVQIQRLARAHIACCRFRRAVRGATRIQSCMRMMLTRARYLRVLGAVVKFSRYSASVFWLNASSQNLHRLRSYRVYGGASLLVVAISKPFAAYRRFRALFGHTTYAHNFCPCVVQRFGFRA